MRLSDSPVVFTSDSNYFFSCNARTIRILSVETGQVVRILSGSVQEGGHSDTVTCVVLNPRNSLQLFSASLDGTIKLWDFNDAILLKTYNVKHSITHMAMHKDSPDDIYLATVKKSTKRLHVHQARKAGAPVKENSILFRYSLDKKPLRMVRLLKSRLATGLAISSDGEYVVMAARYKLHVVNIAPASGIQQGGVTTRDKSRFKTYITPEKISCLAFHPTEGCIATGDEVGRITLWYCFGQNADKPITTTLHWHAHKVAALNFTNDGTYLLSGGEEAVMVLWQLSTGHKQFLPRLGSEIRHITVSPDQSLYALGLCDNSVSVIRSVDLKIKTVIQGLKFSHVNHNVNPLHTGLVIEPRNGHVVLNGLPGTLQFYDAIHEQHIMELEVAPRNKVSRTNDKEIVSSQVMHVAFSSDKAARWMVTVDGRDDKETTPELYIKFWEYDDDARTYILNTRVDSPHTQSITSCIFNPRHGDNSEPMVVTTSMDGTFKIWQLTEQGETRRGIERERSWGCRSTGFYRELIPHCAGFSSDGSLLAVAYGHIITLHGVLTQPPEIRVIKKLIFSKDSPFLLATTKDHLYSWNLLTCSVWWSYKIQAETLVGSQTNSHFLITCADPAQPSGSVDRKVFVFRPNSPVPIHVETVEHKMRAITFMQDPSRSHSNGLKSSTTTTTTTTTPSTSSTSSSTTTSTTVTTKEMSEAMEPILIMSKGFNLEILGGRTAKEREADAEATAEANAKAALEAEKKKQTLMSDIFGTTTTTTTTTTAVAGRAAVEAKAQAKRERKEAAASGGAVSRGMISKKNMIRNPLFEAPSHVMAPVMTLYEAFMDQLLLSTQTETEAVKEDANQDKNAACQEEPGQTVNGQSADVEMQEEEEEEDDIDDAQVLSAPLPASLTNFFSSRLSL
ncbi:hypothetical protein BG004_000275 [Podila humilis]|nr:hypothetical protein BG004_000275 [Podila humilis]